MNPAAAKSAIRATSRSTPGPATAHEAAERAVEVERERETRVYELTVLVLRREASGHNSQRSGRSGW